MSDAFDRPHLLWQPARIVVDASGQRWLEFDRLSDCAPCRAGTGCGASQWARLFGTGPTRRMPLPPACELPSGTRVRAGMPARVLVLAAAQLYLLPLLTFLASLAAFVHLNLPEPLALVLSLVLAFGLLLRFRDRGPASLARAGTTDGSIPFLEPLVGVCPSLESGADGNHP